MTVRTPRLRCIWRAGAPARPRSRGKEAIAAFYDVAISPSELESHFVDRFQCATTDQFVTNVAKRQHIALRVGLTNAG